MRRFVSLTLIGFLCAAGAFAGGNMLQVTSPGLGGTNFKLDVDIVSTANNEAWVRDKSPVCEGIYNAEWIIDTPTLNPGDLDTDDNLSVMLLRSSVEDGNPNGNNMRCLVRSRCQSPPCNPQLRCSILELVNGQPRLTVFGQSGFNPSIENTFRVELVRDTDVGGNPNGIARLFRNGQLRGERLDVDNDLVSLPQSCVDEVRLGLAERLRSNTIGVAETLSFDEFVSTR